MDSADPVKLTLDILRASDELTALTESFAGQPAIFRTQMPGAHTEGERVSVIVDPGQEGFDRLSSFDCPTVGVNVPVRLFALTTVRGDGELSAAAVIVRNLFESATRQALDSEVLEVKADWPTDTPTGEESTSGRRVLIKWIIKDRAHV